MPGHEIAHYQILAKLGAGGMGVVYLAQDARLGRRVALKVLPAEFARDQDRVARFEREARAVAALSHPGIAIRESSVNGPAASSSCRLLPSTYSMAR